MRVRHHKKLTLRELEALARALLAVLFALLHTRVARQKTVGAQRGPQLRIEACDGARQSHAHRASLPPNAAAFRGHYDIDLVREAGELQRFGGIMLPREVGEVLLDRALVYRELARACAQKYARDGFLAAAGAEKPTCARDGRTRKTQRSSSIADSPALHRASKLHASVYPPGGIARLLTADRLPTRRRKAPQRAEKLLAHYLCRTTLETGLQVVTPTRTTIPESQVAQPELRSKLATE